MFSSLYNIQMIGSSDKSYPLTSIIQEMLCSHLCGLYSVCYHRRKLVGQANTVEQDKWHINVFQGGDVGEIGCFLRQTGDDTFYAHIDQILNISFFVLVRLMWGRDNHKIPVGNSHILYSIQNRCKEMSDNIRNDHSDDTWRIFPQAHGKRVGAVVHFFSQCLCFGAKFTADFRTIF